MRRRNRSTGLPPGPGIRHAAHGRRRPGRGPPAHGARRPGEHPRCHPVPDAPPRARMTVPGSPLLVLLALSVLTALGVVAYNRPSSLELRVALRYLRSRRSSRLLSLITVIAVGGGTVGGTALVLVLGVMNGLQSDLRGKILIASPHLRVLTYGRSEERRVGKECRSRWSPYH